MPAEWRSPAKSGRRTTPSAYITPRRHTPPTAENPNAEQQLDAGVSQEWEYEDKDEADVWDEEEEEEDEVAAEARAAAEAAAEEAAQQLLQQEAAERREAEEKAAKAALKRAAKKKVGPSNHDWLAYMPAVHLLQTMPHFVPPYTLHANTAWAVTSLPCSKSSFAMSAMLPGIAVSPAQFASTCVAHAATTDGNTESTSNTSHDSSTDPVYVDYRFVEIPVMLHQRCKDVPNCNRYILCQAERHRNNRATAAGTSRLQVRASACMHSAMSVNNKCLLMHCSV